MTMIYNTEFGGRIRIKFTHPDDSPMFKDIAVQCTDITNDNFDKDLCEQCWKLFNSSGYYHEMIITSDYWIDDYLYVHETIYNGVEIIKSKTSKRYKLIDAPF